MHAAPGVYALLLGSGVSTEAGIPTGWQIVQDLIVKVAAAAGADADVVRDDPDGWWSARGQGEPRYDTLLEALAQTDAMRQAVLRSYFEPKVVNPTESTAHDAIAALCAAGRLKLILTTNFDKLMEQALERAGVHAQVISSAEAIDGMVPLPHAGVTVLKLHGDYASTGLRNTPEELATYPEGWGRLLDRVFDEFGLVVTGWSAEWDGALRAAINNSKPRRYPMYWAAFRDDLTDHARQLIMNRGATVIPTTGAAEFLTDLVDRTARLDAIATRRERPTILRDYRYPMSGQKPDGWTVVPNLQLRMVAQISPILIDDCGIIRAQEREALVAALSAPEVLEPVRYRISTSRSSKGSPTIGGVEWLPSEGAHQSIDFCSYRLGDDVADGASALLTVQFPSLTHGANVRVVLDVGIDTVGTERLFDVAEILISGSMAVTTTVPDALVGILPPGSTVEHVELHIASHTKPDDLYGGPAVPRPVSDAIELSSLGPRARPSSSPLGIAARVNGGLTRQQAAELVVEALEWMALASGWLDPRLGVDRVRRELGVASPRI